jgi:diaminopimelate decarboxylase
MTGDSQFLLTTVLDVKHDGELAHVVLDAGVNVAEPVSTEFHQLFSVSAPGSPATTPYRLVGPICTPADVLYNNWRLPPLEPGHVLAIMDSGAYFVPFSTAFSFPRPAILVQDGSEMVTCRRHESFDDLVALDTLYDRD